MTALILKISKLVSLFVIAACCLVIFRINILQQDRKACKEVKKLSLIENGLMLHERDLYKKEQPFGNENPWEVVRQILDSTFGQYEASLNQHTERQGLVRLGAILDNGDDGHMPLCTGNVFLLAAVHSCHESFSMREAIRLSWGNQENAINKGKWSRGANATWKTVFFLGQSSDDEKNQLLRLEAARYKDIVIGDFLDTYRNLTLKTILILRWAKKHCPQAQYILKTDHDCFVNVLPLMRLLRIRKPLYLGRIHWKNTPTRNKTSKFYVSKAEFSEPVYPPYAAGGGYVFKGSLLPSLLQASHEAAVFPMEDAYFGSLMKVIGVKAQSNKRFLRFEFCDEEDGVGEDCYYKAESVCDVARSLIVHQVQKADHIKLLVNVRTLQFVPTLCEHENRRKTPYAEG